MNDLPTIIIATALWFASTNIKDGLKAIADAIRNEDEEDAS